MQLDPHTLAVTLVFITALLGGLQIFSWAQKRSESSLLLWGASFLLISLAVGILGVSGQIPNPISSVVGEGLLVFAHGLLYSSARVCNRRSPVFLSGAIAVLVWIVASESDVLKSSEYAKAVFVSTMIGIYSFLLASEFRRMAPEGLHSSKAAVLVALWHGAFFFCGAIVLLSGHVISGAQISLERWSVALILECIVAAAALGYLQTSIYKERSELRYKRAALSDELTGIANRRALLEQGEMLVSEQRRKDQSASLLLFDIDEFKLLNDTHGHAVGDLTLQSFASSALALLPGGALLARLGGDEFAALIPATDLPQSYFLANRIRERFRAAIVRSRGKQISATVSAGVAVSFKGLVSLSDLILAADTALYAAKAGGRNQVRLHGLTQRRLSELTREAEERSWGAERRNYPRQQHR